MGTEEKMILPKKRVEYLDIVKGLGIIVVLYFHSRAPYRHYVAFFVVPMFFLVSGFLFESKGTLKDFVIRKIKSLYIPFVFWNLIVYIFVHFKEFSFSEFGFFAMRILCTITKEGTFLGATWFLGSLFTESIIYKVLDTVIKPNKYKRIIITLIFVLRALFAFNYTMKYKLSRTLVLGMFFAIGYLVKDYIHIFRKYHRIWLGMLSGIAYIVFRYFTADTLLTHDLSSPVLYTFGSLTGSYFLICISQLLEKSKLNLIVWMKKGLCYLGRRSLDVLIWHLMCFRIVIGMQLVLWTGSLSGILDYYPVYVAKHGWWLAYIVVGIVASLLWTNILRMKPWGTILKKIKAV